MRRKIQEIIQGRFEYERPSLLPVEEGLHFSVVEHETYSGSFLLRSSTDEPVRGLVACEHPNIQILTPEFDAVSAEIRFSFSGELVAEGENETGVFVVTSSSGEYLFPFQAQISRHYISTSIGRIKTLNDFTNLCSLNWEEALEVYRSPFFTNIFHENAAYYTLLYHSVTQIKCTSHELEEFLIAAGKKKRSEFSVPNQERTYYVRDKSVHISVEVRKSEWGYCDIRLSCDSDFILLGKKRLQMYDFSGKHAEFDAKILSEKLHAGKNFAVISLENGFRKEQVVLTCIFGNPQPDQMTLSFIGDEEQTVRSPSWKKRMCFYQLECSYLSYGLGEKTEEEWILESVDMIQTASRMELQSRWLHLFLAYIYRKAEDIARMEEILLSTPRNTRNARTPLGAMYQYLTVLLDEAKGREPKKAETLSLIREIYAKYRRHPVVNWILLQLDDSLVRSPMRKYEMIGNYMKQSGPNPVFYLEAARILQTNPELLNSRDDFDRRLIGWMSRKNLITPDLALRIQGMAQGERSFSKSYFRVLCKCGKRFGDEGFVRAVCVYLIKMNRYGEPYFPWFKKGIEQHLKIAGLYEAYLMSWSHSMGEFPQEVIRYFSMNSTLPARRKAMLFAYIVRNRGRLKKDWQSYMVMVRNFAVAELAKGHMNDDLAIIYEEIRREMPREAWNRIRGDTEYSYKIHAGTDRFAAVRVYQSGSDKSVQRVPISDGCAYICLSQKPYVILFEDRNGLLYTAKDEYRLSKMLTGNSLHDSPAADRPPGDASSSRREADALTRLDAMAGSVDEMTELLLSLHANHPKTADYARQIMVRMLFTGYFGEKHEQVFRILLNDPESEELVLAYISIQCRSLMFYDCPLREPSYRFLAECLLEKKSVNAFGRAAFLRTHLVFHSEEYRELAEQILLDYLFEGTYFPFFADFPPLIRRKYLLPGIHVLSCQDAPGKTVYAEFPDGTRERMREVLPGYYTWPLRILPGESCSWRIADVDGHTRQREIVKITQADASVSDTRYGRLGKLMTGDAGAEEQYSYAELCDMVNALFVPIKE
ncbi:MAG: DUF5717 family protein [Lachnospiraceae bacterium]|nr:DUF5717 family protein [Lachnospiraceae bacterium]